MPALPFCGIVKVEHSFDFPRRSDLKNEIHNHPASGVHRSGERDTSTGSNQNHKPRCLGHQCIRPRFRRTVFLGSAMYDRSALCNGKSGQSLSYSIVPSLSPTTDEQITTKQTTFHQITTKQSPPSLTPSRPLRPRFPRHNMLPRLQLPIHRVKTKDRNLRLQTRPDEWAGWCAGAADCTGTDSDLLSWPRKPVCGRNTQVSFFCLYVKLSGGVADGR